MKKHLTGKRLLQALLLSVLLVCCMGTTAFAAQYPDVTAKHWAKPVIALSGLSAAQRAAFLASCGWDFSDTWAQTGGLPLLKNMDSTRQQAAQK